MNINDANTPLQNNEDVEYKFNPKLIIQFAIISIAAIPLSLLAAMPTTSRVKTKRAIIIHGR